MTTGLEWNMKVSEKDSKNIVDKFKATFESYFNDEEFKTFTEADEEKNLRGKAGIPSIRIF